MNISTTQARIFRPKLGKIATAMALASALGGLGMTPAFGDEHDNRGANAGDRGHNADRARHNYAPASRHRYHYAQPGYAPPPVYYAPQPSPGISLFIPIVIR
jgi:hypothetical protein